MSERDFKGVWIPKEIWLDDSLTLLEKCIFTEIDSLDNEEHCTAGNEYFSKFCNCSESKITKAIKKLQELGMIEVMSFDGRHRKIRVVKNDSQSSKKYEAESQKVRANNIDNNKDNKVISKDINNIKNPEKDNFLGSAKAEKKPNLYSNCISLIDDFINEHNCSSHIRKLLITHLDIAMENRSIRGQRQYKGILNKLYDLHEQGGDYKSMIQYSIEKGYPTFYGRNSSNSNYKPNSNNNALTHESGAKHVPRFTKEDEIKQEKFYEELKKQGKQTIF